MPRFRHIDASIDDLNGDLALEVSAPVPPPDFRTAVLREMLDAGIDPVTASRAFLRIETIISDERFSLAADAVRTLTASLGNSAAAIALQRVLSGAQGESVRDAADRAGVSHVALMKHERRIRQAVEGLPPGPKVEKGVIL